MSKLTRLDRSRAAALTAAMRASKLSSTTLGTRAGLHPVSIRRYRTGAQRITSRAWRAITAILPLTDTPA